MRTCVRSSAGRGNQEARLQRFLGRHDEPRPARAPGCPHWSTTETHAPRHRNIVQRGSAGDPAEPPTPRASRGVIARNTIVQPEAADYKRSVRRSAPGCRRHERAAHEGCTSPAGLGSGRVPPRVAAPSDDAEIGPDCPGHAVIRSLASVTKGRARNLRQGRSSHACSRRAGQRG